MTHQQTSERFEKAHCLVKNTVALQEAENGALLCSMEIANKPRRILSQRPQQRPESPPGPLGTEAGRPGVGFFHKKNIYCSVTDFKPNTVELLQRDCAQWTRF